MKKTIPLALTILVSTYISPILATENNSWYIGGLYTAQDLSGLSPDSHDFNTAGIIGGYQYNEYISFETRLSKGVSGSEFNFGFRGGELDDSTSDIDYQGSILIKASYPVTDTFNFYATAGYSKTKIDQKNVIAILDSDFIALGSNTYNVSFSENGFTYGLGLNYKVSDKFIIFTDYQILPDWEPSFTHSENWNNINIGFNYAF
tara:strand:- start:771 stop:1382 length:612 start_codon:yes stop_codon:yes gene_type:complete